MKRIEFDNRVEQLEHITGISPKRVDLYKEWLGYMQLLINRTLKLIL